MHYIGIVAMGSRSCKDKHARVVTALLTRKGRLELLWKLENGGQLACR